MIRIGWFKMKTRKRQAPQRDWTKTLPYAFLVLLATLTSAGVGAYATIISIHVSRQQREAPGPTPSPTPTPTASPSATPEPSPRNPITTSDLARQQKICSEWISSSSGKRYNFVCRGRDTFEVYVVGVHGSERIGSGTILEDNSVESDVKISPRNKQALPRNSHWKLKPSADGKKLEGVHSGDDPRETFPLRLRRAQ